MAIKRWTFFWEYQPLEEGVEVFFYPAQRIIFGNVFSFPMARALNHRVPNADLVLIHSLLPVHFNGRSPLLPEVSGALRFAPTRHIGSVLARHRRWLLKWAYIQLFEKKNFNCAAAIQYSSRMEEEMARQFMTVKSPSLLIPEESVSGPLRNFPVGAAFAPDILRWPASL